MDFFSFLNECITPYHAASFVRKILLDQKFVELSETAPWHLTPGSAYFVTRGAAIFAFRTPEHQSADSRFHLTAAHTDFPTLKITPNGDSESAGIHTLHPEIYGSPLWTTWLDRDLGYAGLLAFECDEKIKTKLICGKTHLRIPELAVHLNRGVNQDGLKLNPQTQLEACFAKAGSENFVAALQRELNLNEKLLDFDIQLFDTAKAVYGGLNEEWIFSGRLDNLTSCHALISALLKTKSSTRHWNGVCLFNNEEVGSETREGAGGNFAHTILHKIFAKEDFAADSVLSDSLLLSVDVAHAAHPSYIEKMDPRHSPVLGKGIILKLNAQKRYATDVFSTAKLKLLAQKADVPLQTFVSRNDMPCGSTVGPTLSSALGIPTVDIGEPLLSMHSIREMTAVEDHCSLIRLISELFIN